LPNLANSNLWFCMILMIVCSLAIPAGRSRFNRGQSLLITLTATLTCLVAFGSLPGLLVLDAPDAPVRIAAYVIEALMGGLALLALGVARTDESRGMESKGNWSHVAALSLVQPQPFTVGRLASHAVLESTCSGSSPSSRST
jgi:hypothetical protein